MRQLARNQCIGRRVNVDICNASWVTQGKVHTRKEARLRHEVSGQNDAAYRKDVLGHGVQRPRKVRQLVVAVEGRLLRRTVVVGRVIHDLRLDRGYRGFQDEVVHGMLRTRRKDVELCWVALGHHGRVDAAVEELVGDLHVAERDRNGREIPALGYEPFIHVDVGFGKLGIRDLILCRQRNIAGCVFGPHVHARCACDRME